MPAFAPQQSWMGAEQPHAGGSRTIQAREFDYGRWLGWLKETNQLDPGLPPDARVNRDRLRSLHRRAPEHQQASHRISSRIRA